jgi:hypothetical protein
LIFTSDFCKLGLEEEQHIGVRIILVVEKNSPRGVGCNVVEEGLNDVLWTTGNDDAEWEGWIVGGLEQGVKDLLLVGFVCTGGFLGGTGGITVSFSLAFVKAIDENNLGPIRVPSSLSQWLQKQLVKLRFELLLENSWIVFDAGENTFAHVAQRFVLNKLVGKSRDQTPLESPVGGPGEG